MLNSRDLYIVDCAHRPRAIELATKLDDDEARLTLVSQQPGRTVQLSGVRGSRAFDVLHCGLPLFAVSPRLQEVFATSCATDVFLTGCSYPDKLADKITGYRVLGVRGVLAPTVHERDQYGMPVLDNTHFRTVSGTLLFVVKDTTLIVSTESVVEALVRAKPSNLAISKLSAMRVPPPMAKFVYLG